MDHKADQIVACSSDADLAELGLITILGGGRFAGELRGSDIGTGSAKRADLISAVRAGTDHVELMVDATTFRQKPGVMNRKYIRVAPGALDAMAKSYVGMPILVDHDSRTQASRIGTIMSSEMSTHGGTGWSVFNQQLKIVKPEAVISVLDGTIDRFSVAWLPTGPVMCSVHGVDVRGPESCCCWPGDGVMVDGETRTVEYEFSSAEGTEVSAVNVPAVLGTKVNDIRTALALELDFAPRSSQPATMNFARLMAILGLNSLATPADEDRALQAIEDLRRGRLAAEQERDTARTRVSEVESERDAERSAATAAKLAAQETQVNALIEGAYRDGKLGYSRNAESPELAMPSPREARLRRIAAGPNGLSELAAELAEMPQVIPIGKRVVGPGDREPAREPTLAADVGDQQLDSELQSIAEKSGQSIQGLRAEAARIRNRRMGA